MNSGIAYLCGSKNGEPRQLPFGESEVLTRIIREQRASASAFELRTGRPVAHVFHYCGRHLPEGLKRAAEARGRRAKPAQDRTHKRKERRRLECDLSIV